MSTEDLHLVGIEVSYACDILETLEENDRIENDKFESKDRDNQENNAQESRFTLKEVKNIAETLEILRSDLHLLIRKSSKPNNEVLRQLHIVNHEIDELKKGSLVINKKEWKIILISSVFSLFLLFAFSTEARATIKYSYEILVNIYYEETVLPDELALPEDILVLDD